MSAVCTGLIACGGGSTADSGRIQYTATAEAGKGTLADYMNATWLYDNYFGEMGLPQEIKPKLMVEMQRLANGFTLQYKLGEDVKSNMEHFHTTMNSTMGKVMMANFAQKMSDENNSTSLNVGTSPSQEVLALLPAPSAEALETAKQGEATDAIARANLKAIIQALEVPYDLSENATPWTTWSPSFIAQKAKFREPPITTTTPPAPATFSHGVATWNWTPGDVIYAEWNTKDNSIRIFGQPGI